MKSVSRANATVGLRAAAAVLLAPLFGFGLRALPLQASAYEGYQCPQGYIVDNPTQCAAAPEGGDKVLAASASW